MSDGFDDAVHFHLPEWAKPSERRRDPFTHAVEVYADLEASVPAPARYRSGAAYRPVLAYVLDAYLSALGGADEEPVRFAALVHEVVAGSKVPRGALDAAYRLGGLEALLAAAQGAGT